VKVLGANLEVVVSALKDAVSIAKEWRDRYLALEEAVRKALRCLERGDAGTARKILTEALSAKVVDRE
jgi:hypothetical protein